MKNTKIDTEIQNALDNPNCLVEDPTVICPEPLEDDLPEGLRYMGDDDFDEDEDDLSIDAEDFEEGLIANDDEDSFSDEDDCDDEDSFSDEEDFDEEESLNASDNDFDEDEEDCYENYGDKEEGWYYEVGSDNEYCSDDDDCHDEDDYDDEDEYDDEGCDDSNDEDDFWHNDNDSSCDKWNSLLERNNHFKNGVSNGDEPLDDLLFGSSPFGDTRKANPDVALRTAQTIANQFKYCDKEQLDYLLPIIDTLVQISNK